MDKLRSILLASPRHSIKVVLFGEIPVLAIFFEYNPPRELREVEVGDIPAKRITSRGSTCSNVPCPQTRAFVW